MDGKGDGILVQPTCTSEKNWETIVHNHQGPGHQYIKMK